MYSVFSNKIKDDMPTHHATRRAILKASTMSLVNGLMRSVFIPSKPSWHTQFFHLAPRCFTLWRSSHNRKLKHGEELLLDNKIQ